MPSSLSGNGAGQTRAGGRFGHIATARNVIIVRIAGNASDGAAFRSPAPVVGVGTRRPGPVGARAARLVVAFGVAVLGVGALHVPSREDPAAGDVVPGSYLVTLTGGDPAAVAADQAELGVRLDRVFSHALDGYSAHMTAAVARELRADPRVRAVTPDRRVAAADQGIPPGIVRTEAVQSSTRSGDGKGEVDADIAVLDTGIDVDHPDLNVVGGVDCVSGAGFGGPLGDGAASLVPTGTPAPTPAPTGTPARPGTAAPTATPTAAPAPSPAEDTDPRDYDDTRGHGTHIAGIAAARDNGVGIVGVAPGARLWAVRVLDSEGDGTLASLICGIDWVTAHADVIDVANMSLSGLDPDQGCRDGGLHEAICRSVAAGVTYTVAAGNDSADARDYSPGSYDEVLTVSALADYDGKPGGESSAPATCPGTDDDFATFSNYGPAVDLVAPGVCILSTWMRGGYATLSGTSQAAAYVAGAAALYRSSHPKATPAQVRAALIAAGSQNWDTATDPDGHPDPLVDVAGF
jgi:subtilisin family serine protease